MTFFREAFTKERKETLSYDNNAFSFFAATLILLIFLIWTVHFVHDITFPLRTRSGRLLAFILSPKKKCQICSCKDCKEKVSSHLKSLTSLKGRWCRKKTLLQGICLIVLYLAFHKLVQRLLIVSEIGTFQPYEILNITRGTAKQAIRKAYLRMSLLHHPDRHPNDPLASAKFILITKAYHALSDETARANYEKYGNPDGPTALQIGIGLPQFLVDEEYQLFILALFLLVVITGIPFGFILYYQHQKNFYPNGVRVETIQFLGLYINESTRFKRSIELFAASAESREMRQRYAPKGIMTVHVSRPTDAKAVSELQEALVEKAKKSQFPSPLVQQNMTLILAHLERLWHLMTPELMNDLQTLLQLAPAITQSMIDIAFLRNWYPVVRSILELRRCLTQALTPISSPLMQVPHYGELPPDIQKKYKRNFLCFIKDVIAFQSQPCDALKVFTTIPQPLMQDIFAFCQSLSIMDVTVDVFVQGEAEFSENDLFTFRVTLTRTNLDHSSVAGPVHCPCISTFFFETWWIFMLEKETVLSDEPFYISHLLRVDVLLTYKCSTSVERQSSVDLQVLIPYHGERQFTVMAMCDSYTGLDVVKDVNVKVLPSKDVMRPPLMKPDDEVDVQPCTLYESFFGTKEESESDSSE